MIWLVWRRQRAAIGLAGSLLAGFALGLVPIGMTGTGDAMPAEIPPPVMIARLVLLVLPAVIGVVLGSGLFGRELERGTHVFALTQSVGRVRWWATGLLALGLPAAVAVAAVTRLAEWALGPAGLFFPLGTPFFDGSGLLPVAHLLLAFAVASAAGLIARNALTAVAASVAAMLVVQIVLPVAARPNYAEPITTRGDVAVVESAPVRDARTLDTRYFGPDGAPVSRALAPCPPRDPVGCLRANGFTEAEVTYQPADRYWRFQAIEAAALVALSAIAVAAGWWGLRRRVW